MYIADRLVSKLKIGQHQPTSSQVVAAKDMVAEFGGYNPHFELRQACGSWVILYGT